MNKKSIAEITSAQINMKTTVFNASKMLEKMEIEHSQKGNAIVVNGVKYSGQKQLQHMIQCAVRGVL